MNSDSYTSHRVAKTTTLELNRDMSQLMSKSLVLFGKEIMIDFQNSII